MRFNNTTFAIVFAVAVAAGVLVFMMSNGWKIGSASSNSGKETVTKMNETTEAVAEAEGVANNPALTDDFVNIAIESKHMSVEKVIRKVTDKEDGSSETEYETYLLSEIDMERETELTTDYSKASVGNDFQVNEAIESDFLSEYGMDIKGSDSYSIYKSLLEESGIDGNLDTARFDSETYDKTGQEVYVLSGSCKVIEDLLAGEEYDELISSEVSYQIVRYMDKINRPDFFTAVVQYRKGNEIITKNLFLQILFDDEI